MSTRYAVVGTLTGALLATAAEAQWQHFTDKAKRAVFFAQEAAERFGENSVSPEHLLLGLLCEEESVALRVLERLGVPKARARETVEKVVPKGAGRTKEDITLDPRARKVMDLTYDEMRLMGNQHVGTEHLLLGILREADGPGARALAGLGVDLAAARKETTAYLASAAAEAPHGFRLHARFTGIGGCLKQLVGPGPEPGSERLYASHIYGGDLLDVVAVDPLTGKCDVFSSPIPGEVGAWALALGPDGQVYVGTLPRAHVLRVDWKERKLVDMGRPSESEQYIWQLALGTDKKLYGCTYPQAKLVRFDPATGKGEDLGRMDDQEQYARTVAADDQGFVYTGIGMSTRHLAAYEIATGQHRDILPAQFAGTGACGVHRGDDGVVYATAGGQNLRLEGWNAVPIEAAQVRPEKPLTLADGRAVAYASRKVTVRDAKTGAATEKPVEYAGRSQSLFRIGPGPDGRLYASTAMPIHFLWADPEGEKWEELGQPGSGEFYSFLAWKDALVCAAYGGDAPLMLYRPGKAWAPAKETTGNPWLIHYAGENGGWRPMALIAGPDEKLYLGAVAGYGLLGGPITVLDPADGKVDAYHHVVKDQSVIALAALPGDLLVGGTTVGGGGGSHPTQTEARLLLWDARKREKVFETVPVPGRPTIEALVVGGDGLVYGFAGPTLFVFDPQKRQVLETKEHGLGSVIYNAIGAGPEGKIYGLASGGIFTLDTRKRETRVLSQYPGGIHGGFAIIGRRIYFTSGPQIVSYGLP